MKCKSADVIYDCDSHNINFANQSDGGPEIILLYI